MNKRVYSSFLALLFVTLAALLSVGSRAERRASAAPAATYLLSSLPASDAVIFIDAQRLLTDSIPNLLATSPKLLARVNKKIDQFKEQTEIDLRTFDSVAIGVRFDDPTKSEDFKLVVLTEGRFDANNILDAALKMAKREDGVQPQERQYNGRTLYVLSHHKPEAKEAETAEDQKAVADSRDMAMAVFDANTFIFGDLESVRAALDISTARVSDELVQLATSTPGAVIGFSGNVPPSVREQLARDKETLARNFAAVRQVYGSLTTTVSDAQASVTLRTENAGEAREVSQAVNALKLLCGFNTTSSSERNSIPGLINDLTVTNEGNEVFLNLKLTRADIRSLLQPL
jgi:hypothetical protein